MSEYADYHHAMAQHAINTNQLHPTMTVPMSQMISAGGLNLTVMPGQLANNQHHQIPQGHQIVYTTTNVQPAVAVATSVQQQQQQHHQHHHHQHKKAKKPKVNKDGVPAPKRAATPFINFTQWYREELKKTGRPVPKIAEFGKECAAKWAAMQEDEKKPFLDAASRDRDRYKREMAIYKPARDESKPKRPGTAFMLFMVDFRKEMAGKEPEGGVAALAKLGGERWRGMTEEDKRPYVEKQNVERVRYESSMEEYRRKGQQQLAAAASAAGAGADGAATKSEESDSDSLQQQQQQQAQGQIHLTPASTTAYLISGTGAVYSQIQTPYNWN